MKFAKDQGWSLEDGRIYFPTQEDLKKAEQGDQREIISNTVGYARELEMIV